MSTLTSYARIALPLVPGASRLPFVPGGGGEMPAAERVREGVRVDRDHLAAYARVCGFPLRDALPATYPHVLAFGLHLELMTDGDFPFPAAGLVHIANSVRVRRPIGLGEPLDLRAHATPAEPHPKGRAFSIVTEVEVDGEVVWEERSTMLRRGGGEGDERRRRGGARAERREAAEWRLGGDLGRRYGAVSGDRNPIHLHPLTARLFGFPRPIAHGMWTKARCLAALDARLPEAFSAEVEFRRPILLPARVVLEVGDRARGTSFAVRAADDPGAVHLEGKVGR